MLHFLRVKVATLIIHAYYVSMLIVNYLGKRFLWLRIWHYCCLESIINLCTWYIGFYCLPLILFFKLAGIWSTLKVQTQCTFLILHPLPHCTPINYRFEETSVIIGEISSSTQVIKVNNHEFLDWAILFHPGKYGIIVSKHLVFMFERFVLWDWVITIQLSVL